MNYHDDQQQYPQQQQRSAPRIHRLARRIEDGERRLRYIEERIESGKVPSSQALEHEKREVLYHRAALAALRYHGHTLDPEYNPIRWLRELHDEMQNLGFPLPDQSFDHLRYLMAEVRRVLREVE